MLLKREKHKRLATDLLFNFYRLTFQLAPQRYGYYNSKNGVAKNANRYYSKIISNSAKKYWRTFCPPIFLLECKKNNADKKRNFFF
jgi:hypothetical protein